MEQVVYHGSNNGTIEVLKSNKSTHQRKCIYAAESKAVALLFMGKGNGDLDKKISDIDGDLVLVERREGVLNSLYNKPGYLYVLDGGTFSHYDYLWSREVISFEQEIRPIKKIYYENILDALFLEEQKGNLIIYRYPNRPSNMPLDNSDLIDKYINFEKKGLKGSIKYMLSIYPEFTPLVEEKMYN
ncbi:MAG: hypothetical protein HFH46_00605 [Bacilli bacterium]|nr:hypothetical protein [Bacilli bacterium]